MRTLDYALNDESLYDQVATAAASAIDVFKSDQIITCGQPSGVPNKPYLNPKTKCFDLETGPRGVSARLSPIAQIVTYFRQRYPVQDWTVLETQSLILLVTNKVKTPAHVDLIRPVSMKVRAALNQSFSGGTTGRRA